MDAIKLRDKEVVFIEESFDGLNTSELGIPYDELRDYEIQVDLNGSAGLDEFLTSGGEGTLQLNLTALPTSKAKLRGLNSEKTEDRSAESGTTADIDFESRPESMPPVPEATSTKTPTDDTFYKRLKNNPDSQPAVYRRLLRNEGEIERRRFDNWCKRHDYEPETGGSHNASLLMLERIGEIERYGRGDDQRIVWVGE